MGTAEQAFGRAPVDMEKSQLGNGEQGAGYDILDQGIGWSFDLLSWRFFGRLASIAILNFKFRVAVESP